MCLAVFCYLVYVEIGSYATGWQFAAKTEIHFALGNNVILHK